MAANAPSTKGTTSARPDATKISRRFTQASLRSSSSPAAQTNNITAHCATPFSAPITGGVNTLA